MTRRRSLISWLLTAAVALSAAAATASHAVTAEHIAQAMGNIGMQVEPEQVTLLADVVATTANPDLKVRSMERTADHRVLVRLECQEPRECLPFYVALRLHAGDDPHRVEASPNAAPPAGLTKSSPPSRFAVRAGSPAVLLLDGAHIHIRIPVICMQNGAIGQTIRVTGTDHRQVYTAQVFEGGLVKGRL